MFGCDNDRFGGNGSILSIHAIGSRSRSSNDDVAVDRAPPVHNTTTTCNSSSSSGTFDNDNSNTTATTATATARSTTAGADSLAHYSSSQYHAYPIRRGVLGDEAIAIFQKFYLSENRRAPESKRKRKALRVLSTQKVIAASTSTDNADVVT